MGIIRCTCVYRASSRAELDEGRAAITVALFDPFCPAADLHARTATSVPPDVAQRRTAR